MSKLSFLLTILSCFPISLCAAAEPPGEVMRELRRFPAEEAHQGVATDAEAFIAISSRSIARYSKSDGRRLASWTAREARLKHFNSGLVLDGRLYCAHSNWPTSPLRNTIEIFDAVSLKHLDTRDFPDTDGAINWIDRHEGSWWIVFAFYGPDQVQKTRLVRYDDQWKPIAEWRFPESVLKRFLPYSNSGGAFGPNGRLFVTGHDHGELYVLKPLQGKPTLEHLDTMEAPIAGQGIAWDRSDIGLLYGIVRKTHEVVVMRLSHAEEYAPLRRPVTWIRDSRNPILPPRPGEFDATRCMNPWVVREGNEYRLFYSGGDTSGRQQIAMATAAVDNLAQWKRSKPLFSNGPTGSFDARWCVLPHVVPFGDTWRLYYTGNAGRGEGLSAFPGIGYAFSEDARTWRRSGDQPVLAPSGSPGAPDAIGIAGGSVLQIVKPDGQREWRFYYTGCPTLGKPLALNQQKTICLATSRDGVQWEKQGAVMIRDPDRDYENIGVAGPVVHQDADGSFRMWYSAIGTRWGYYSICYAESDDGLHWRRGSKSEDNLQLTPQGDGWESQMVEYPSVIRERGRLRLFYCGNGYGRTGIGVAISKAED